MFDKKGVKTMSRLLTHDTAATVLQKGCVRVAPRSCLEMVHLYRDGVGRRIAGQVDIFPIGLQVLLAIGGF